MLRIFFLFLLMGQIHAQDYSVAPEPVWITKVPVSVNTGLNPPCDNNACYLLVDRQFEIDKKEEFNHVVFHFLSHAAVQDNSILEIEFNPKHDSIVLHKLALFRNNEWIDQIPSSQINVIDQESRSSSYIYTGKKQIIIILDDTQPGDILDYSFSRIGQNPVFKDSFTETIYLQCNAPINHSFFQIISSKDRLLNIKNHINSLQPTLKDTEDKQMLSWEFFNVPPLSYESSTPNWFVQTPLIQISSFQSWSEIAQWGKELYKVPQTESEALKKLIHSFQAKSPDLENQILQAIRFVQRDIRYLGLSFDHHNCTPYDPSVVLKRRSGDCKDKSLLLISLLKLLGVEASPVLVNTSLCEHIQDWLPSPGLFDHAIVQIRLGDETFWVDPTASYQGGNLRNLSPLPYGKCLVLDQNTIDLTSIPLSINEPSTESSTTFEIFVGKPSRITNQTVYRGLDADKMRAIHSVNGQKEIEKSFESYFTKFYGVMKTTLPFTWEDDLTQNEITVMAGYEVDNILTSYPEEKLNKFSTTASDILGRLDFDLDVLRQSPQGLMYPSYVVENVHLILPEIPSHLSPMHLEIDNNEISFIAKLDQVNDHHSHHRYELKTKQDYVPVERILQWREELISIKESLIQTFQIPIEDVPLVDAEVNDTDSYNENANSVNEYINGYNRYIVFSLGFIWLGFVTYLFTKK